MPAISREISYVAGFRLVGLRPPHLHPATYGAQHQFTERILHHHKKIVEFFSRGKMTWFAALLNIIVGVILLMAVTICKPQMQWLILTIGVVSCVGGTAMFFIKQAKLKSLFVWLSCRGNWFYRIVGLLEIALGSVLIYSI